MTGTIWGREPVAIAAAVRAVLVAVAGFGFDLEPEQIAGIVLAVEAVLAVAVRGSVYAPATVDEMTRPTQEPVL